MKPETIYYQLTLAAPLHIGCGEVYEPMGFVVDQESRELISFNPSDFLEQLSSEELEKFSAICRRGTIDSIQDLYKFMRQHQDLAKGVRINVSNDFARHYDNVLNKQRQHFSRELNQFEINRTAFNPIENAPIIPGSSFKGAIRTAVLNARNKGAGHPPFRGRNGSRELQEHLLDYSFRNVGTDPFRLVKISDFVPVGEVKRTICYAVDVKKKPSDKKPSAPFQMQEIIEPGSSFLGSITILPAPRTIKKPVSLAEITNALQQFFGAEKQREDRELKGINVQPVKFADEQNIPLRLGRHSGAECVTVNGHRNIRIMQGPGNSPKFKNRATTIWLASAHRKPKSMTGLQSMGWVELCPLSESKLTVLQTEREQMLTEQQKQREQELVELARLEAIRLQQQKEADELRRQQEQEAAAEQARHEAMQKQWQGMSDEEQDIAIVFKNEIALSFAGNKDALRDIWPKFDKAEAVHQKNLAQAFSELWKETPNKWRKNQCSERQWQKVKRVVEILGLTHDDILHFSAEEEALVEKIKSLRDWGQYKNEQLDLQALTLPLAQTLAKKLKKWGCNKKRAKKDKQNVWKELQSRLKSLRR